MSEARLRIRCAICDKPVDDITVWKRYDDHTHEIRVRCHGDSDTMALGCDVMEYSELVGQIMSQEGIAFATARLAHLAKDRP